MRTPSAAMQRFAWKSRVTPKLTIFWNFHFLPGESLSEPGVFYLLAIQIDEVAQSRWLWPESPELFLRPNSVPNYFPPASALDVNSCPATGARNGMT